MQELHDFDAARKALLDRVLNRLESLNPKDLSDAVERLFPPEKEEPTAHYKKPQKVMVTIDIVWAAVGRIVWAAVDRSFTTAQLRAELGCRGEQISSPLAALCRMKLLNRETPAGTFSLTARGKKRLTLVLRPGHTTKAIIRAGGWSDEVRRWNAQKTEDCPRRVDQTRRGRKA